MWNISRDGFVSVVEYDPKADRRKNSPFLKFARHRGTHLLIRARLREHLEPLRKVVPNLKIEDDISADYKFRVVIPRKKFKKYMCDEIDAIHYTSHFKEVVRDAQPTHLKGPMYSAMMHIWSELYALQPGKTTYWGTSWSGKAKKDDKGKPASASTVDIDEWLLKNDTQPWTKPEERVYMADAMNLVRARGKVEFTEDEIERMTDTAFEFYLGLQQEFGNGKFVPESGLVRLRDEVLSFAKDSYNKKEI